MCYITWELILVASIWKAQMENISNQTNPFKLHMMAGRWTPLAMVASISSKKSLIPSVGCLPSPVQHFRPKIFTKSSSEWNICPVCGLFISIKLMGQHNSERKWLSLHFRATNKQFVIFLPDNTSMGRQLISNKVTKLNLVGGITFKRSPRVEGKHAISVAINKLTNLLQIGWNQFSMA